MTKYLMIIASLVLSSEIAAAVLVKDKMWPRHSTLNVVFLDGTSRQHQLVKDYAPLWTNGSSLKLKFFDGFKQAPKHTHIRVSFKFHTGSVLGNHGELESRDPTLQLSELNDKNLPINFARRLILHEFGHALGFEHEYRNPRWPYGVAAIQTQIEECFPRLVKIGYDDKEARTRCIEINETLESSQVNSTTYDEFSIMNYPQKIRLKDSSLKHIKTRFKLSILDKLAMERWYGE